MAQGHASTANPRFIVPVPITLLQQIVLKRGRNGSGTTTAALNFPELRNLGEFWDQTADNYSTTARSSFQEPHGVSPASPLVRRGEAEITHATRAESLPRF
jgi:hypothetical protein